VNPPYEVVLHQQAEQALRLLPADAAQRVDRALLHLARNPRSPVARKISADGEWKFQDGAWCIFYIIDGDKLIVPLIELEYGGRAYDPVRLCR
jgi:mRNA-degrading endonuclease RelE of RelBE toxin-antitoxin system